MNEGKTRSKASTEEIKEKRRDKEKDETATLAKESDPAEEVASQLTGGGMTLASGAIEEDQKDEPTKKAEQREKRIKMLKQQVAKLSAQVMSMKNGGEGGGGENGGDSKYVSDMMAKMKEHIRGYEDKLHLAEKFSSELKASNVKLSKMVRQREDELKAQAIKFKAQGERNDELVEQNQALLKKVRRRGAKSDVGSAP